MRKIIAITFLFSYNATFAQSNPALRDTLAKLMVWDQKAAGLPPQNIEFSSPAWQKFKDSVFAADYAFTKSVFQKTGFPGYDQVGKDGAKSFWLMVQHCDKWPEFQESVLASMEKQVAKKNASPQDFAYLTDRVKLNTGRSQIYGSQVTYNLDSCQAVPRKLENPATVNERRRLVGLDTLELYLNQMSESHFAMNQAGYEKKGIHKAKLYERYPPNKHVYKR